MYYIYKHILLIHLEQSEALTMNRIMKKMIISYLVDKSDK